ncbi:MAG: hypothetical protein WBC22_12345 [Sedimentisphaerales bacterium]
MTKETLDKLLSMTGLRHTSLMEFWADLMNMTKGEIAGWLVETGYKTLPELKQFLRPNQIEKHTVGG